MRLQQYLTEGVYDKGIFKAIFLAGSPGSGKSFVQRNVGMTSFGLRVINSDDVYEYVLKKSGLGVDISKLSPEEFAKSQVLRDIAKKSAAVKKGLSLVGRLGVIIDGTAKDINSIEKQKDGLEELGYDTYMVFVNVPLEVSLERNKTRERKLKDDLVIDSWKQVQYNMGKFQQLFGNKNFMIFDNVDPNQDDFTLAYKGIKKFIDEPAKNPIAVQWIEYELEKKNRN